MHFSHSWEQYFNIHRYRQERIGIQFPLNTPPLGVVLGNQVLIPPGCALWLRAPLSPDLIWSCLSVCSGAFTPGVSGPPHPPHPQMTSQQLQQLLYNSIFYSTNMYCMSKNKCTNRSKADLLYCFTLWNMLWKHTYNYHIIYFECKVKHFCIILPRGEEN